MTTEQFPTTFIEVLLGIYSNWTHHGLLYKDSQADDKLTLLDYADTWLTDSA